MFGLESALLSVVAFLMVLGLVVVVHELGHFQAGRWGGITIDTFSLGFGRTLKQWRDRRGVTWRIAALPLGGYVKFAGDADPVSSAPIQTYTTPEEIADARRRGIFHAMPVHIRAFAVAAGPMTNFLFAILAFALIAFAFGRDVTNNNSLSARIDAISAGGPAANGGLQPGDVVIAADGASIASFGQLQQFVRANPGKEAQLTVRRGEQVLTRQVVIGTQSGPDETGVERRVGVLGVERATHRSERTIERVGPIEALGHGARQTWTIIASTGAYVGNIVSGKASASHIAGPAGIFAATGAVANNAVSGEASFAEKATRLAVSLFQLAAFLSVGVGLVNLLPVPILDGGHLLFYAIEAIRGRPLSARAQEIGYNAGLAFVASLFLFATWNDLQRFKLLEFLGGMLS